MKHQELRKKIQITLPQFNLYSEDVEELLVFSVAVESNGIERVQRGFKLSDALRGFNFAIGLPQIEKFTYEDLKRRYSKRYQFDWMEFIDLAVEDELALLVARIKYLDSPEPIPDRSNISEVYRYYKDNYNSSKGASRKEPSIKKYLEYIK